MPLEINSYNDAFRAFVNFAEGAKRGSTIAQIDKSAPQEAGPLSGRTIIAKQMHDSIGNVGRFAASRAVNNDVRALFMQAVADMFGGENKIPSDVLDAMKLSDYGKGKPLTARRILAVKTAIDRATINVNSCIEECKQAFAKRTDFDQEKLGSLIEKAFIACNRDKDAMKLVKDFHHSIIMNGANELRSEESVQRRVENLVDNLGELKALSAGRPAVYAAGLKMLDATNAVAFQKGVFTKLLAAADKVPLDSFQGLSAKSSGMDLHKATVALYRATVKTMSSIDMGKQSEASEATSARNFFMLMVFSRCDKATLQNIRKALGSETAATLNGYYELCARNKNPFVENESFDVQEGVCDFGRIGTTYMDMIDYGAQFNLEVLNPGKAQAGGIPDYEGDLFVETIGGDELIADTVAMAKEVNTLLSNSALEKMNVVSGSGQGVDTIKGLLRQKMEGVRDPEMQLAKSLDATANAMMNWNICAEMKKIANGEVSQFSKDIDRRTNATLSDGQRTFKLSNNFEKARDELTQFVTGNPDATFKGLATEKERNKVYLLMAMISQESEKAAQMGAPTALDPRDGEPAFGIWIDEKTTTRTFTIQKQADGGISFNYVLNAGLTDLKDNLTNNGNEEDFAVGAGSKLVCKLDYNLTGAEIDRLADQDIKKFDDSEGIKLSNQMVKLPGGGKGHVEHLQEKVVESFDDNFKISADCKLTFSMELNPSDDELIENARMQV